MMKNKKIALLASILVATLVAGVYAGLQLSNPITASWTLKESGNNLVLSWAAATPTGDLYRGRWYNDTKVRLQNTGDAAYNVIVKFKVWIATSLPENSMRVLGNWGTGWQDIATRQWDSALARFVYAGTWGPSGGFNCTSGWDITSEFRYMFEASAPIDTTYYFEAWVEQVP